MEQTLIIGVGNSFRGDDAAGIIAARNLKNLLPDHFDVKEMSGEGVEIMEAIEKYPRVIIIDAVQSGSDPGRIHRLHAGQEKIPSDFFHYSTHAFSVAEAVEMSRALKQLPDDVTVFGIEGKTWEAGAEITPAVSQAIEQVTQMIVGFCNAAKRAAHV